MNGDKIKALGEAVLRTEAEAIVDLADRVDDSLVEACRHLLATIGLINPGVDFIVRLQMRGPGWGWFRFTALGSLYVGDQLGLPIVEVSDDIFDGPMTSYARLVHSFWPNFIEKCFPLLILFL
jgi:hypothetical protein